MACNATMIILTAVICLYIYSNVFQYTLDHTVCSIP